MPFVDRPLKEYVTMLARWLGLLSKQKGSVLMLQKDFLTIYPIVKATTVAAKAP